MPTLREVRTRIRSVKNIAQITRALEAVSASRVRRAQARALASRVFSEKAWEILVNVQNASVKGAPLHPLLTARDTINKVLVVLITSDRGLAGAYNTNILRVTENFVDRLGKEVQFVTIGRKGRDSLIRAGYPVIAEFSDFPAEPTIADVSPIARLAMDAFLSGEVDEVVIAYTDFISMLSQRPAVLEWLPLSTNDITRQAAGEYVKDVPPITSMSSDYEYEPSPAAVLDEIVPRFTVLQLYQAILEAQASEHAARMVAMRNATDNATQLAADLTLEYNKARQTAITSEILDIVGGANALQNAIDAMAAQMLLNADNAPHRPAISAPTPDEKPKTKSKPKADKGDDLTKIEGIGPKMAEALKAAGITTFARLATATEAELTAAIQNAGMRFAPSLVTWAEQAKYAAEGDWEGLEKMQSQLVGGRKN